jgi:hypothetical protein
MDNMVQLLQCINLACLERRQHFFTRLAGGKEFFLTETTEKPSSKLCLFPAHALACIVDFILAISQLVQRGF